MRILYVTDLHGRVDAYEKVLERAAGAQVKAIVNGGDLFPLGPDLFAVQREFVTGYLPGHLERCAGFGLDFLSTLGNMDLCGLDDEFKRVMHAAPNAHILLEREATLEGYTFIGSPMTTDGPFSLKDRCLRDTACSAGPAQSGKALISDRYGIHQVEDWPAMRSLRPPLSEHLAGLPEPEERSRVIHVLHQPPSGLGLGMISQSEDVGSRAVAEFIARRGGRLSLHGHIHESPFTGGKWQAKIGHTTCVQPGQLMGDSCVSVVIDLESLEMDRTCN